MAANHPDYLAAHRDVFFVVYEPSDQSSSSLTKDGMDYVYVAFQGASNVCRRISGVYLGGAMREAS